MTPSHPPLTLSDLERALALPGVDAAAVRRVMRPRPDLRGPEEPPPGVPAREAGVLILAYPHSGSLSTLLIRRMPSSGVHSGQISFPGGACEPEDADPAATALREACEEVGVCGADLRVLGPLAQLYIPPSRFLVWPLVAALPACPDLRPSPAEVAGLIHLPLADLLDDGLKCEMDMRYGDLTARVPYYAIAGEVVWGATAMILAELEARLRLARG